MKMKKRCKLTILLTVIGFSAALQADELVNLGKCSNLDEFKHGFNMITYQQCMSKINQCPKNGPYLDTTCVQKNIDNESSCKQLGVLATEITASPELISAEQIKGFTIFDVAFPADSGHQYSILSPSGCLIDTVVDPRDLNSAIKTQYAKNDFYLEAKDKPKLNEQADGTKRFTIDIQAKNQCRACETIGIAKIAFDFYQNGEWKKTQLLSFEK